MLEDSAARITSQNNDCDSSRLLTPADGQFQEPSPEAPPSLHDNKHRTLQLDRGHRIIAVASGKGGVGKTWFSVTLSHALARAQRRVLLFDGDLRLANVDVQLGLIPRHDIADVVTRRHALKDVALSYGDGVFDIVPGRSGMGWVAGLSARDLNGLGDTLTDATRRYQHVVIDTGAGVGRIVRKMTGNAGIVLLVVNTEPTTIVDTYTSLRVLLKGRPASDIRIVVNSADDLRAGMKTYEVLRRACEGFLEKSPPLAGIIRHDPCVVDATRRQTSLLDCHPNCQAAKDVHAIAQHVLDTA